MNTVNKTGEFVEVIAASWERCRNFDLRSTTKPDLTPLSRADREKLKERNRILLETTEREVLPYYENILSNSMCMILLTDQNGSILNNWGDRRFMDSGRAPLFQEGVSWLEKDNGTNAIGTAIACGHAVQVQRNEHYLRCNRFMIGSAAPILNEEHRIIGVLSVCSDAYLPQAHTLGMVRLMSQSVENRLMVRNHAADCFLLTFNTNADNLDSQWSGLIAFDEAGTVVACNRRAEMLLTPPLTTRSLEDLFDVSTDVFLRQPDAATLQLLTRGQRRLQGQIRRPTRPGAAPVKEQTPPAATRHAPFGLRDIEFGDRKVRRCVQQATKVVDKDIPILIHGETGVGKEVFVKALHQASTRRQHPMVAVNCAAIPAELVESELFGYEKGAFTGASSRGAIGLIRKANQGILFLDEIGEMPLGAQARLLRVLQEREVTPLGSVESYPVDIRLISATNQPLRQLVEDRQFRRDLYYRVSGLNIELPPLRHRTDKRELFRHIHARYAEPGQPDSLPNTLLDVFERHAWPGNIRQLINVVQVALAMAEQDPIDMWHLPDDFILDINPGEPASLTEIRVAPSQPATQATVSVQAERIPDSDGLLAMYNHYQGNVSRTARQLGYSRNTVYKRLRELGVR
ncbi:MAG: sigma-54-dependent Fis family transcriptional regulator [Oleiphilaceae bacterium]|nr:sigma-54-dependent Fis family transcriptional regulator [Oleiphilaceae bacterium]